MCPRCLRPPQGPAPCAWHVPLALAPNTCCRPAGPPLPPPPRRPVAAPHIRPHGPTQERLSSCLGQAMSFRSFGGEYRKEARVSLAGRSRVEESRAEVLERTRRERERRRQEKLEQRGAASIQARSQCRRGPGGTQGTAVASAPACTFVQRRQSPFRVLCVRAQCDPRQQAGYVGQCTGLNPPSFSAGGMEGLALTPAPPGRPAPVLGGAVRRACRAGFQVGWAGGGLQELAVVGGGLQEVPLGLLQAKLAAGPPHTKTASSPPLQRRSCACLRLSAPSLRLCQPLQPSGCAPACGCMPPYTGTAAGPGAAGSALPACGKRPGKCFGGAAAGAGARGPVPGSPGRARPHAGDTAAPAEAGGCRCRCWQARGSGGCTHGGGFAVADSSGQLEVGRGRCGCGRGDCTAVCCRNRCRAVWPAGSHRRGCLPRA